MSFDNIPEKMKQCPHWIVWKLEDRGGKKPTKTPYNVRGGYAKVNDPNTWATFKDALQACQSGGYNGIGFVFTDTLFIGIDIDGCIDPITGEVKTEAIDALETLQSYTELSQSGTGFHVVLEGKLPPGRRRNEPFEMYGDDSPRYFAMTGQLWGDNREIRADQAAIDTVHSKYIEPPAKEPQKPQGRPQTSALDLSDQELIERARAAKNGGTFSSLWNGDVSAYGDDDSRADLALCNILAFWCQRDHARIDRLFRQSGLMRPKWDEMRGRGTYGNITIEEAIARCSEVYSPQRSRTTAKQDFEPAITQSTQWEPPIPFETITTPDFPTESLPAPVAAFVEALAESTQTPEEMAAVLSLGVLATAFQGRYKVQVKPDWKEPLNLFTVAVAPPAERKSAVISALTAPLNEYEATRRELEAVEIAQNQTERALLEKALQNAQSQATKKKGNFDACRDEALALSAELAEFEDKHPFRLLVDDTTTEKLIDIMDMQGGCITVVSSEGGVFDSMAGRYDKNANFDVYLKGHAGDLIKVDRIGRKPNHIPHPRLTMILAVQPEVLSGLMNNPVFRGQGLCGRFLYSICKSKMGKRRADSPPIPDSVRENYCQFIKRILSDMDTGTIYLSEAAKMLYQKYYDYIEKRLVNEFEHMQDWGGKLVGAMVRIAAIIHAAETQGSPTETPMSGETVSAAIGIAEYLSIHAMAAYQVMGADESREDAKYLLKRIESTGQDEISKRDLLRLCHGKFPKAEELEAPLEMLIDMNYIKREYQKTGGKPSEKIIVNPECLK